MLKVFFPIVKKNNNYVVVLSGHNLDGNLKAYYEHYMRNNDKRFELYFIALRNSTFFKLKKSGYKNILKARNIKHLRILNNADCIISSHGNFFPFIKKINPTIKLIDVWHGTQLISYDKSELISFSNYDYFFLQSDYIKNKYLEEYDFKNVYHKVTGLARHDRIYNFINNKNIDQNDVKKDLNILKYDSIILYCPTWRSVGEKGEIPFGLSFNEFFNKINEILLKNNSLMISRFHQNSFFNNKEELNLSNILTLSQKKYSDTEKLLCISDIMISDWSSIITDFCLMNRPIILLNTKIPKKWITNKVFIDRGGEVVNNLQDLEKCLVDYLSDSKNHISKSQKTMHNLLKGNIFDGKSCLRYDKELKLILGIK